jgi:hypothetical protein
MDIREIINKKLGNQGKGIIVQFKALTPYGQILTK